jgi:acetolactate synthase regulatory subunit
MTTATESPAVARAPRTSPHGGALRLAVRVRDVPDALVRVLGLLQRRRCHITSVDFAASDPHRPGRLVVGVVAPPRHAHCVATWVGNLVDVLAVETLDD